MACPISVFGYGTYGDSIDESYTDGFLLNDSEDFDDHEEDLMYIFESNISDFEYRFSKMNTCEGFSWCADRFISFHIRFEEPDGSETIIFNNIDMPNFKAGKHMWQAYPGLFLNLYITVSNEPELLIDSGIKNIKYVKNVVLTEICITKKSKAYHKSIKHLVKYQK
jgi:hypothetical protein